MLKSKYFLTAVISCMVLVGSFALADVPAIPAAVITAIDHDVGWHPASAATQSNTVTSEAIGSGSGDVQLSMWPNNDEMRPRNDGLMPNCMACLNDGVPGDQKIMSVGGLAAGIIRSS